ncbi:hypothetical protein GQ43DRAFT_434614 [Delitschia confertaspora ATCC 74209]|uniref:Uncharacterized protein n=1 Tax=Delitschia confertaspora ATCC 74209 TaxID=1513339 RepID=A0A9P4JIX7_9PLEO|nr:hypothetical protein GQ43DRAFT_434614 [Delitschia confertaspora ATCC 74209]
MAEDFGDMDGVRGWGNRRHVNWNIGHELQSVRTSEHIHPTPSQFGNGSENQLDGMAKIIQGDNVASSSIIAIRQLSAKLFSLCHPYLAFAKDARSQFSVAGQQKSIQMLATLSAQMLLQMREQLPGDIEKIYKNNTGTAASVNVVLGRSPSSLAWMLQEDNLCYRRTGPDRLK